ncbi:LacI family DNA-binding transcriptional regulator [Lacibacter sediminis]|uniref:LacI family DNA-binding transcriptional regulator n=1 Tax=Lacibacter sediminis TaxID=2760713 RepID=A0A7G5XG77_9BACT|nr:LacI family DNA-binding transcriptional regulator [Lacibacter sediminis]QNA44480.1 LacI family DNA-binding transcriptional regulator [Lacibacter sediminis]
MANATLKKIAQVLDISISTVSRALKNHPDISQSTKQKVMELAETLEYEPNAVAVNLRSKNTKVFGILIPSITNNFYDSFIAAVEEEVKQSGYSLMILQSADNPETEIANLKIYRQNRVSGVFVCLSKETTNLDAFHKMKDAGIPVVFFDKVPDDDSYNRVCLADKEAAVMAAEALLKKNKKNILGIFGDTHMSITKRRLKAFQEALPADKNIKLSLEYADTSEEAENISNSYFQLKKQPDAVFCMSDEILMGVMKSVQKLKIEVPQQTGIITLSDGFFPKLYYPEITFVETSGYRLGKLACERMMQCVKGKEEAKEIFVSSRFVEGGSL